MTIKKRGAEQIVIGRWSHRTSHDRATPPSLVKPPDTAVFAPRELSVGCWENGCNE
jgi:hypothetical protein